MVSLVLGVLLTISLAAGQLGPGCSFDNGQCSYNIKLDQCDNHSVKRSAQTDQSTNTGLQSCSCTDVQMVSDNVHTLTLNMQTLQSNFDALAQALNVTQEQLVTKDKELAALLTDNQNLTGQIVNYEMLLNKSQVDLANTVSALKTELDRVRTELVTTNDKLVNCQTLGNTAAPTSTTPALYGDYTVDYCGFEDASYCGYLLGSCSSSNTDCWTRGSGRQNVYSGPIEDHTYGAAGGHYMYIDPLARPHYVSSSITHGTPRYARITSYEFPPAPEYCLRFWYTLVGDDIGVFKVYAQVGGGDGYPIYSHSGEVDKDWHMVQLSIDKEYSSFPFKIVFEGSTASFYHYSSSSSKNIEDGQGYIAFDDVFVYNTSCSAIPACPAGSYQRLEGNVTSCYTIHVSPKPWYDAVDVCKTEAPNGHLVTVNSQDEQTYLVDLINQNPSYKAAGDQGWYTSGNDERSESYFKWTDNGYPYDLNYTNWHIGQPNNVGDSQDCLLLEYNNDGYEWGDVDCKDAHPFICEIHVM